MQKLEQQIEAILFFKAEPVSLKKLAEYLEVPLDEIQTAVIRLREGYVDRGMILVELDDAVSLGTAPELAGLIENLQKEDLNKELSKASLETLSIILYKNGASRAEIDHIRGVNSSFTLRALCVRGLVEKTIDPKDSRKNLYKPTLELISYLGINDIHQLPEFDSLELGLLQAQKSLTDISSE